MNLLRRLTADVPAELLAARLATVQLVAPVPVETAPAFGDQQVFAALAFLEDHRGVIAADMPGLPIPVEP